MKIKSSGCLDHLLMPLVYVGKSALAQTGSAVNKDSHKDVEVYW